MTELTRKWDERFLRTAKEISTWSKDPSTQVGAIIVNDDRRILATGYNGFPRGIDDSVERLEDRENKYKFIVHAEMNAIYNATYNGISLNSSTLYVWGLPVCSECAKGVIQVGIKKIVMPLKDYPERWLTSFKQSATLFIEAGVKFDFIVVE